MNPASRLDVGARFLLVTASVVVLIAGLKAASSLILPFMLSVFVALVSLPLLNWLQTRKVPRAVAVLLTILAVVLVLSIIVLLVGGTVNRFIEAAPRYQDRLQQMATTLVDWLRTKGIEVSEDVSATLINPGVALELVTTTLSAATALLSNLLLVFLTSVFILFEATGFSAKLESAFGPQARGSDRIERIRREVQRYLGIKTAVSLITGLVVGVSMWLLGIDFAVLWGLLAFSLNYIPSLGSILAAIPPVLLAIVQYGIGRAAMVALVFLAVNVVLGNFLEPQFMGRRLGLSTLVVFLSLVFWGWVWGPVGMLLSVPLTMVVKIMLENTEDLRWIAVLLDANPEKSQGS